MANPQLENGHTQIANELLEAICKMPLSNYESRVFWFIIRKTYGYKKKTDWIAQRQIVDGTGLYRSHVSRTIKKLLAKKMITKDKKQIGVQKDYDLWMLPEQVTISTNKKLPIQVPKVTNLGTKVTNLGTKKLPIQVPTKEKKETITKETIQKKRRHKVLQYWNNKGITKHQDTKNMLNQIRIGLKKYKPNDIKLAIDRYDEIYKSNFFYSSLWRLDDFLKQGNGVPAFLDGGKIWIKYEADNKPKQNGIDDWRKE